MSKSKSRIDKLETTLNSGPAHTQVIIYDLDGPEPVLPINGNVIFLIPDNGRDK